MKRAVRRFGGAALVLLAAGCMVNRQNGDTDSVYAIRQQCQAQGVSDANCQAEIARRRCIDSGGNAAQCMESGGGAPQGPSHPPATPAQWADLEQRAQAAARAAGATDLSPPERLTSSRGNVRHQFQMQAGRCYHVAIAWGFNAGAEGELTLFEPEPGTGGVQDFRLPPSQGVSTLCASRAGGVGVRVSATSPQGNTLDGELLEYALVVGSALETEPQRQARLQAQLQRREAIREQMEENLFNADLRRGGMPLARGCSRCRTLHRVCLADRRAGAGGVSSEDAAEVCRLQFDSCAQSAAPYLVDDRGRHACGAPLE